MTGFKEYIVRTLLYYEIFDHPLTSDELFYFLPMNSMTKSQFIKQLSELEREGTIVDSNDYYRLPEVTEEVVQIRAEREQLARSRMLIARAVSHIIKRFPFVRGIFLSGDLSKGVAHADSDIDYVIVTAPHRLWICRSLLVVFKKTFLLNSKRFFCLNYYVAENNLLLEDQNYFTATEIAHLKPLFNIEVFLKYMNENAWIKHYFPNYKVFSFSPNEVNSRRSLFQRIIEFWFQGRWADHLDEWLMRSMERIWAKRYPQYDSATRERIFRCTPTESCAYVGNYSDRILGLYREKLERYNLPLPSGPARHG